MFGARREGQIVLVVTMVTVIGILGSGFFGAGMRAVQEREENILRRYKVTPITPVPLLLASIVTGVILYLPSVVLMLFLAHQMYGMAMPSNLFSLFVFICLGAAAFRSLGLIIASVVNSMQESNIITQVIYMPMLFLSGATFPLAMMPTWLQIVTQFIPATYLVTGISAILQRGESIGQNLKPVAALLVAMAVSLFIATKLFRWEKEERIRPAAKLWVLVVLLPFFLLGIYEAESRQQLAKTKVLARDRERGRITLIQNARIVVGNGELVESGAILIRNGKIIQVYKGNSAPDAKSLGAEPLDAAGKTVLPGLIDVHVHLGGTGGFLDDWTKFDPNVFVERALESYVYCGVTAVRSVGDQLDLMLRLRQTFGTGEKLGSELFFCGPLFTAEGGHGTEYAKYLPPPLQARFTSQFLRMPKTPDEARQQVDELATEHVDAIKAVLEQGVPGQLFNRMDINVLRAVVEEAHAKKLPVAIHCGNAADVTDAIAVGADSIEHGSFVDEIPDAAFVDMKTKGIAYDPTLSVVEGLTNFARGDTSLLKRSLVQQVTTKDLLIGTEHAAADKTSKLREGISHHPMSLATANNNLLKAWRAGVTLVTGSDAGNPMVMHGPTVQHELELWLAAGIPADQALQAATLNSAKLLRADNRIGTIEPGKEASLLIVDGNPLQDIHALSAISFVIMKGEWVARRQLFEQK